MTERDALLSSILADPDANAPRLIFADWLDEHDEGERAEFIRVQIELAKFDRCTEGWSTESGFGNEVCQCKWHRLGRREKELLNDRRPGEWSGFHSDLFYPMTMWRWVRGFVSHVKCSAYDCLTHLDEMSKQQPIESVELTTIPEMRFGTEEWTQETVQSDPRIVCLRVRWGSCHGPFKIGESYRMTPMFASRYLDRGRGFREERRKFSEEVVQMRTPEGYFHVRWPQIKFTFPQPISAEWSNANGNIRENLERLREQMLRETGYRSAFTLGTTENMNYTGRQIPLEEFRRRYSSARNPSL